MEVILQRIALALIFLTLPSFIVRADVSNIDSERLVYEKACDAKWKTAQQGRHRHLGRAVCSC